MKKKGYIIAIVVAAVLSIGLIAYNIYAMSASPSEPDGAQEQLSSAPEEELFPTDQIINYTKMIYKLDESETAFLAALDDALEEYSLPDTTYYSIEAVDPKDSDTRKVALKTLGEEERYFQAEIVVNSRIYWVIYETDEPFATDEDQDINVVDTTTTDAKTAATNEKSTPQTQQVQANYVAISDMTALAPLPAPAQEQFAQALQNYCSSKGRSIKDSSIQVDTNSFVRKGNAITFDARATDSAGKTITVEGEWSDSRSLFGFKIA